ncbi:MAG: RidA family protein [Marinobacter sp.]|uniref:RidA family protein n=1 Tax=Marinobacter sp. TaxID=50741 RepID=UPI00396E7E6C
MTIERFSTNSRMSRIVKHNGTVYLCGQVAKDRNGDIQTQVIGMLEKVDDLLQSVGTDRTHILSATIYLADMEHFNALNEIWDNWIPEGYAPARACVQAQMASPELLVEISVIAATDG